MAIRDTDRYIIWSGVVIFNILGHFGNINVVFAHYRLSTLQTKYGILLSLLAFSQSICLLFELVNILYGVLEPHVIRSTCFYIISPYIFMHCAQTGLMATISVDLFISIIFPLRHRVSSTKSYLSALCIPTVCYAAIVIIIAITHMDNKVIGLCNPPLSLPPLANQIWYFVAFCFGGVTIATYIFSFSTIWARGRKRSTGANVRAAMHVERKAMKSLSVLLVVFIVTRFLGTVMANLMNLFGANTDLIGLVQSYNVFSAMICYSSSFYVCFLRSAEYRRIFWAQIAAMFKVFGIRVDESLFALSEVEAAQYSRFSHGTGHHPPRTTTLTMERGNAPNKIIIHPIP